MEISLFHHLSGAWLGYRQAIAEYPELSQSGAIAESFWQAFLKGESTEIIPNQAIEWSDCPLENALAMLPMLLYYHEDPIYLSDRLEKLSLPSEELVIAKDLGQCLSSILRETVQVDRFTEWLDERSPELADETTFLRSSYEKNLSWHSFNKALAVHSFSKTSQQLLQIYGVMLWSYGQIPQMKVLSAQCSPIIQAWVLVLMGSLRGDRHFKYSHLSREECDVATTEILLFWSHWSGLPPENQLQLGQLPVIASTTSLRYRPSLKLISQRHLYRTPR